MTLNLRHDAPGARWLRLAWVYGVGPVLLALLLIGGTATSALADPIVTVTNTNDSGAGSLRQAITDVSAGGTILFDANLTASGPATITLTSGELSLGQDVTISGPGADLLAVSGNAATRVFAVNSGVSATIDGLTIRDGTAPGFTNGGGIYSTGTLAVISSTVTHNSGWKAAGIYNSGTLLLSGTVLDSNSGMNDGGGIYNAGTFHLLMSTVSRNSGYFGGGIFNTGATFNSNSSGSFNGGGIAILERRSSNGWQTPDRWQSRVVGAGRPRGRRPLRPEFIRRPRRRRVGAIEIAAKGRAAGRPPAWTRPQGSITDYLTGALGGTATVYNSTVYSNTASRGGGIYVYSGVVTVTNSTVAGNSGTDTNSGSGIASYATLYLRNSLVAHGAGGADCYAESTLAENTNNLVADGSCSAALSGDPRLGTLGDFGGDTQTIPLLPGSPAIDAGDAGTCLATDQRGVARPQGSACDIGAYEAAPILSLAKQVTPATDVPYEGVVTYTLILSNTGGASAPSVFVTDTLPAGTTFADWIEQSGAAHNAGEVTWNGAVSASGSVTVSFAVTNTAGGAATITNTVQFVGAAQAGSATATYTTASTLTPSGPGNWSDVFPPCTGVCHYVIPAGVAITLTQGIELTGNLTVEAGAAFVPNGQTVTLTGDQAQTLAGNPLTFYNLVVNKTASDSKLVVTIDGKLKVTKKLTVRSGKLVSASDYEDIERDRDRRRAAAHQRHQRERTHHELGHAPNAVRVQALAARPDVWAALRALVAGLQGR